MFLLKKNNLEKILLSLFLGVNLISCTVFTSSVSSAKPVDTKVEPVTSKKLVNTEAQNAYSNIKFKSLEIKSQFASFNESQINFLPNVPPLKTVKSDLSNIKNIEKFSYLSDSLKSKLVTNYFAVDKKTFYENIYEIYDTETLPVFITTDSVLHSYHLLYDFSLRYLEIDILYNELKNLSKQMLDESILQYQSIEDSNKKELALKNLAFFAVANKILDNNVSIPDKANTLVKQELQFINTHEGFNQSPIFGYKEDYSQYNPRGHYTRNDTFKKYFKAMMWYGRMMFRLKSKDETYQALLITTALNRIEKGFETWDKIYQPTVFFVGKTDDLTIIDYAKLANEVFNKDGKEIPNLISLSDPDKLNEFINKALLLKDPQINSSFVRDNQNVVDETKGFRFMGQRFVPDAYMFQQLIHDKVKDRYFAKGLDVMSILGSDRADQILKNIGENNYLNYDNQIQKLKQEFNNLSINDWSQNLYWSWLYTLKPLLELKTNGYPDFMLKSAWQDKDLNTALGSWAELKHDTILYSKQPYSLEATAFIPLPESLPQGYVEPNIKVYLRLKDLTTMLRSGLNSRNLTIKKVDDKLKNMEELLDKLIDLSKKELTNQPLNEEEYKWIKEFGKKIKNISTFEDPDVSGETDDKMAIIADVQTDVNTNKVLEVGVGNPLPIYVIVPDSTGEPQITRGGVFSYYEFTHNMNDRLTDETWQTMIKQNSLPPFPDWMNTFIN